MDYTEKLNGILTNRKIKIVEQDYSLAEQLLKEFARRMILWSHELQQKRPDISLGSNIVFDVGLLLFNKTLEIHKIQSLTLSFFDYYLLSSNFNFIRYENEIRKMGFEKPNPYTPYLELFKIGAHYLTYKYSRLEVYPFFGINVFPRKDFMKAKSFWNEDDIIIEEE